MASLPRSTRWRASAMARVTIRRSKADARPAHSRMCRNSDGPEQGPVREAQPGQGLVEADLGVRQRDDGLEMQFDPVGLEGLENETHAAGLLGRGPAHRRQQGRLGKACRRHLVHKGEPRSKHRRSAGPDAILFPGGPGEVPQEASRSLRPHGRAQDQRSRLVRCRPGQLR